MCGNTVSSTIPLLIGDLRNSGRLRPGKRTLLIGFGVGLSWAGCQWTETWSAQQAQVGEKTAQQPADPAPAEAAAEPKAEPSADVTEGTDEDKCREAA